MNDTERLAAYLAELVEGELPAVADVRCQAGQDVEDGPLRGAHVGAQGNPLAELALVVPVPFCWGGVDFYLWGLEGVDAHGVSSGRWNVSVSKKVAPHA